MAVTTPLPLGGGVRGEGPLFFIFMRGLVIKNTGSWYTVKTEEGKTIDSKIKGNFRLKGIRSTNPVAVGDHVVITPNQEGTAFITEIERP